MSLSEKVMDILWVNNFRLINQQLVARATFNQIFQTGSGLFYRGIILLINNMVQSREVLISIRIQWILNSCKEVTVTGFNLLEFSAKQKNGDFSGG